MRYLQEYLDKETQKMVEFQLQTRGGAVWQLVGLITRRSQVQILSPQPVIKNKSLVFDVLRGLFFEMQ